MEVAIDNTFQEICPSATLFWSNQRSILPISFAVTQLTLGQSYDNLSDSKTNMYTNHRDQIKDFVHKPQGCNNSSGYNRSNTVHSFYFVISDKVHEYKTNGIIKTVNKPTQSPRLRTRITLSPTRMAHLHPCISGTRVNIYRGWHGL